MINYLDFHTHSIRRDQDNIEEIVSLHRVKDRTVNKYTIGYHPWWSESLLDEAQLDVIKLKFSNDPNCIAIGEFGLDKLKGPDLKIQEQIVRQHLNLAQELSAPVIIHCVRAYHLLLDIKKDYDNIPTWVIHGYNRHQTLAKELMNKGFLLSVCPTKMSKPTFIETIQYLPTNKFFLETDSHPYISIEEVYEMTSNIKNVTIEKLSHHMFDNLSFNFSKIL